MTGLTGVTNDEVWESKVPGELAGIPVWFISRDCLLRNKRATGRPKDLGDAEELELIGE